MNAEGQSRESRGPRRAAQNTRSVIRSKPASTRASSAQAEHCIVPSRTRRWETPTKGLGGARNGSPKASTDVPSRRPEAGMVSVMWAALVPGAPECGWFPRVRGETVGCRSDRCWRIFRRDGRARAASAVSTSRDGSDASTPTSTRARRRRQRDRCGLAGSCASGDAVRHGGRRTR